MQSNFSTSPKGIINHQPTVFTNFLILLSWNNLSLSFFLRHILGVIIDRILLRTDDHIGRLIINLSIIIDINNLHLRIHHLLGLDQAYSIDLPISVVPTEIILHR